jgi:hypothetical protein
VKQADDICGEGEMQRALRESKAQALMLGPVLLRNMPKVEWSEKSDESV